MYPLRCPTVSRGSSGEQCRSAAGAVAISTAIVESQCVAVSLANFGSDIGADVPADDCTDRTSVTVANKSAVNKTNSTADAQSHFDADAQPNWCSHTIANSTSYEWFVGQGLSRCVRWRSRNGPRSDQLR